MRKPKLLNIPSLGIFSSFVQTSGLYMWGYTEYIIYA